MAYHGYKDLVHYLSEMSAMGDTVDETEEGKALRNACIGTDCRQGPENDNNANSTTNSGNSTLSDETSFGRIETVSIPLCMLFALDDPLTTWKNVVANEGYRHPSNLSRIGQGNLMILLTKRGGHVGWPTGWFPGNDKWKWMSEAMLSFGQAVNQAKRQKK